MAMGNVGVARTKDRSIKFGLSGMADIAGIKAPLGRAVEIELKTKTGRQSQSQKDWQAAVERAGGIYILARSRENIVEVLG